MDDAAARGRAPAPAAPAGRCASPPGSGRRRSGALFSIPSRSPPPMYCETMYGCPPSSPMSKTVTMFGWSPRRPIACASRFTRDRPASSRPSVLMTATATSRSSFVVVREVDLLAAALAEEALDGVAAVRERSRERRWRRGGGRAARRRCLGRRWRRTVHRRPAGITEARLGTQLGLARRAAAGERRAAGVAEASTLAAFGVAGRTEHVDGSPSGGSRQSRNRRVLPRGVSTRSREGVRRREL